MILLVEIEELGLELGFSQQFFRKGGEGEYKVRITQKKTKEGKFTQEYFDFQCVSGNLFATVIFVEKENKNMQPLLKKNVK